MEWLIPAALLLALAILGAMWAATRRRLAEAEHLSHTLTALLRDSAGQGALAGRIAALEAAGGAAYNPLLLADHNLSVIWINAAARDLFGWKDGAATVIAVTHHHEVDRLIGDALSGSGPPEMQIVIAGRPYRIRAQRVEVAGEVYAAAALEDVSELQRLGRARRDMVANISHELRTPISGIRLLADTLLRGAASDAKRRKDMLTKITVQADALQQLADELLDLATIESGRAEMLFAPVSIREICGRAVERLAEQSSRKQINVENACPPDLNVLVDSEQIEKVLVNLLHNAVKFSPEGGAILVTAVQASGEVVISVTDNGPGIAPHERARIFERFYRADRARGRGGTGLGLAIARHIIAAHGGTIRAEAAPGGHGARLIFRLPAP